MTARRSNRSALRALLKSLAVAGLVAVAAAPAGAGRPFRVYASFEGHADTDLPPDYDVPAEFVVGRLMYPAFRGFFGSDWERGGTSWAVDYPRGDRSRLSRRRPCAALARHRGRRRTPHGAHRVQQRRCGLMAVGQRPALPAESANLGLRIGFNFAVYALTQ